MKGRVLIILPNDELDGAEQVLFYIASYYAANDYEVDVFFMKLREFNGWDKLRDKMNLHYTRVNKERFGILQMIGNLRREASHKRYAYAYTSHTQVTGLVGLMRQFGFLKIDKFIARESTSIFVRFTGWKLIFFKLCYRYGFRQTDLLICQTEFMREQLFTGMPRFFHKLKNIEVIPNPVVYSELQQLETQERPYERKYLVSAGRLIPEKGHDLLIRSFKEISEKHKDLDLLILGRGVMKDHLLAIIDELQLKDRVVLVGHVKNVYPFFKYAEACVVSSRCEGFPNVLLQMMSQNKRVVSTLCAGGIENLDGVFTCAPDSAPALMNTILQSLVSSCSGNLALFQTELMRRDISSFVNTVQEVLYLTPLLVGL